MKTKALALALLVSLCEQAKTADKPNILPIVSDDQGYADAGFQGSKCQCHTSTG